MIGICPIAIQDQESVGWALGFRARLKFCERRADKSSSHNWRASMKINDSNLQGVSTNGTGSAHDVRKLDRSGRSFSAGSPAGDITKDRFEFSGALGQLSRSMAQSDAGRASLVDALAAQYQ